MYDSAIRKNISVFYDEISVSFENLRFVAPSLPVYIKNSNYVDRHSWGKVRRYRGCPRHRGGGHSAWNRNSSCRACGCGGQGKSFEDSHGSAVIGIQNTGKEDCDQSGSGGCSEERQWLRPSDSCGNPCGIRAETFSRIGQVPYHGGVGLGRLCA